MDSDPKEPRPRTLLDFIEEARVIALAAVLCPDGEYLLRKIARWYSREFHTPLHTVEADIPLDDLLRAYFEVKYEDMDLEDRDEELQQLVVPLQEREEQAVQAEADDDEFLEEARREAREALKRNPALASLSKPEAEEVPADQPPLAPALGARTPLEAAGMVKPPALAPTPTSVKFADIPEDEIDQDGEWGILDPGPRAT